MGPGSRPAGAATRPAISGMWAEVPEEARTRPWAGEVGLGRKEAGILAKERPRRPYAPALNCTFVLVQCAPQPSPSELGLESAQAWAPKHRPSGEAGTERSGPSGVLGQARALPTLTTYLVPEFTSAFMPSPWAHS